MMRMRRGLFRGVLLRIRPKNQLSLIFSDIEPPLQRVLRKFISRNDVVFDIGANIGYVSIAMSKLVGDHGHVFSFEPIESTADECQANLDLNGCKNVTLFRKALSDEDGVVEFRVPNAGQNNAMASMVWHKDARDTEIVDVQCMILDQNKHLFGTNPSFIKIDVEGAEGKTINGMKKLLEKTRPVLFVECSEIGRQAVWDYLKSINYQCFFAKDLATEVAEFSSYKHDDFVWLPDTSACEKAY